MDNIDKVLDMAKEFDGAQFSETLSAGVEKSLVHAVVMHGAEAPSTRAKQEASKPIMDALRTAVEKGVVARTDVHCQFMRGMEKDAEAKREYDACTGRVAKTEFRRAWAERQLKVVETEPVAGQTRIQSRRLPQILAHCKGRGVWYWKAADQI